jgi:hypothetical protein
MDETDAVLQRLRRIERLRTVAPAATVLGELRLLVPEAEAWARAEGDARAQAAARKLREEAEGMQ